MGAKKLNIHNKVVLSNKRLEAEKLNIREVWKKLWWAAARRSWNIISAAWEVFFKARIVENIAPGVYREVEAPIHEHQIAIF